MPTYRDGPRQEAPPARPGWILAWIGRNDEMDVKIARACLWNDTTWNLLSNAAPAAIVSWGPKARWRGDA